VAIPQATDLFTALAKDQEVDKKQLPEDAKNPVYASSVRVQVLNGTGIPGRAVAVAEKLRQAGFTVAGTGNAPETTRTTTVSHPQGLDSQAEVLAARLPEVRSGQDTRAAADAVTLVAGPGLDPEDIR
jgi:hypothetical protein